MRVVFAKHLYNNTEYLFSVPDYIKEIKKGDTLILSTYKGLAVARASSDITSCESDVAVRLGAYLPLKQVVFVLNDQTMDILKEAYQHKIFEDSPPF